MKITNGILRAKAGDRSFSRGEDYFARGQVRDFKNSRGIITAKVSGTEDYRIKLWESADDDEYDYDYDDDEDNYADDSDNIKHSCTCPVGQEGGFCKHCVAVGLAWIDRETKSSSSSSKQSTIITIDDIREWLVKQSKETILELLMQQVVEDHRLHQQLAFKAAKNSNKATEIATYRNAILKAARNIGYLDYYESSGYADEVLEAIEPIDDLIAEGKAKEALELIEETMELVEKALCEADDSNGEIGGVLEELQKMHYQACLKEKPSPEILAQKLFSWELKTDWDTFHDAAAKYAKVLGAKGLAAYRKLAAAEWAKVPSLTANQRDTEKNSKRYSITHIMEALAKTSGDIEELVAVKKRDLSSSYNYLNIAEIYREAKKYDSALEWAERGAKIFAEKTDSRLRDFLAEEYHRRKRHTEAMEQIWLQFIESPYLSGYQKLKEHADRIRQWEAWRKKALQHMRQIISQEKKKTAATNYSWEKQRDHSELVCIFLWEKDVEAAWNEAQSGGCNKDLWLELAAKCEQSHPREVLLIYQKQIEPMLEQKNNQAYQCAVDLLKKIKRLMLHLKMQQELKKYLDSLRIAHKAKRNFIKFLQAAGL